MSQILDLGFIFFCILILSCFFTKKWLKKTLIIITIIYYLIGSGIAGNLLAKGIVTNQINISSCSNTKAIILLGAGSTKTIAGDLPSISAYDRIIKTAQVYAKYPQLIIISGGTIDSKGSEADIYAKELYSLNIPKDKIIIENKSTNTYENAKFTKDLLQESENNKYCLVTDGLHLKRAILYYEKFNIDVIPLASSLPTTNIKFLPNSYNIYITQRIVHEWFGLLKAYIDIKLR
ncbi:YdcF family protein [Pseudofrancisella aestuarii]|uniref:YdcF family protein n=1 Tax=Pseudofrancisella aestuarii TaxID=2670347 RepID=A0ABV9T9D9_9GAMM|nr:YdcF family protein [Pseudofrancisella aestuarii]